MHAEPQTGHTRTNAGGAWPHCTDLHTFALLRLCSWLVQNHIRRSKHFRTDLLLISELCLEARRHPRCASTACIFAVRLEHCTDALQLARARASTSADGVSTIENHVVKGECKCSPGQAFAPLRSDLTKSEQFRL
eukprot:3955464-Pleurochrysis_carterae.AAC.1